MGINLTVFISRSIIYIYIIRIRRLLYYFPGIRPLRRHLLFCSPLLARSAATRPCGLQASEPACNGCKRRLIGRGMYRPRRAGRGMTSFPSDAWSALVVCAWCAGYSASDGSRNGGQKQPVAAGRTGTMFGLQKLQLKNTLLIRCAGIRVRAGGAFVRLHTA